MRFHIVTIFPDFFRGPFSCGVVGRAKDAGLVEIQLYDLREWTSDVHRTVDDRPFGGDEGMVMKIEPIDAALADISSQCPGGAAWKVLLSAQGRMFDQSAAQRLAGIDDVLLVCGRYEGVDERVAEHLVDEELSVGSYVLSGGEWGAGVIVDSVSRLSSRESSATRTRPAGNRSARWKAEASGVLDCPQYTRPASYSSPRSAGKSWDVPEVLLSGHHGEVARWRREAAIKKTRVNRPDLLRSLEAADGEARDPGALDRQGKSR